MMQRVSRRLDTVPVPSYGRVTTRIHQNIPQLLSRVERERHRRLLATDGSDCH